MFQVRKRSKSGFILWAPPPPTNLDILRRRGLFEIVQFVRMVRAIFNLDSTAKIPFFPAKRENIWCPDENNWTSNTKTAEIFSTYSSIIVPSEFRNNGHQNSKLGLEQMTHESILQKLYPHPTQKWSNLEIGRADVIDFHGHFLTGGHRRRHDPLSLDVPTLTAKPKKNAIQKIGCNFA